MQLLSYRELPYHQINTVYSIIPALKAGFDQNAKRIDAVLGIATTAGTDIHTAVDSARRSGVNIYAKGVKLPVCVLQQSLVFPFTDFGNKSPISHRKAPFSGRIQ